MRFTQINEERIRLTKEVLMIKLIDTVYFLEEKIREGKINEQGDILIIIKKGELKKIKKDLKLESS